MCFSTPVYKLLWAILRDGSTFLLFHILKHTHFTFSAQCVRLANEGWFTSSSMIHDSDQITMSANFESETKPKLKFFLEFQSNFLCLNICSRLILTNTLKG